MQKHYFVHKGLSSQGNGFSSGHLWMWVFDYKESWVTKNGCFWTVGLEKTLESPLDYKEIQPVHPKGDQSWMFIGRADVEAETPILWPPDVKSYLIWKDPDAGKDWREEEKGTTEDEMVGWHHWLNRHGFGWTLGVGDRQGGLVCCGSWGHKELDVTERLNWTELPYSWSTLLILLSSTPFPLVIITLFSVSMCLFLSGLGYSFTSCLFVYILHMSKSIQYLFFSDISFNSIHSISIHFVSNGKISFFRLSSSPLCVYVYVCVYVCVWLLDVFIGWLLICFWILAIVNNVVTIGVPVSFWISVFVFFV